ncbi:hypothetical protein OKW38_001366 [Paraburkholderia sp. MM5496-R1]|uniref:hypothetical protein n=1 Tax=Paraburkholderia sp. MM5496-R1 TaxID=2991065 RepID=UPI003D1D7B14
MTCGKRSWNLFNNGSKATRLNAIGNDTLTIPLMWVSSEDKAAIASSICCAGCCTIA